MIRAKCRGCGVLKYCSMSYDRPFCRKCWPKRHRLVQDYDVLEENRK